MKTLIILLLLAMIGHADEKEDYRVWTDKKTLKTIRAAIMLKNLDSSKAQVKTENGKVIWLKADQLIDADKHYIEKWTKFSTQITARVVASKKGCKKLKVIAKAGNQPIKVVACQWRKKNIVKHVPPGEELTFFYWAPNKYWVRGYEGDKLVDEETYVRKSAISNVK